MDDTIEDVSYSLLNYGLGYCYYFNALRDAQVTNDLKVFLQHPARIYAEVSWDSFGSDNNYEDGTTESSVDYNSLYYGLGGAYYFPSNTGLGLFVGLGSRDRTNEYRSYGIVSGRYEYEHDLRLIRFYVDQYLAEKNRFRLSYVVRLETVDYKPSSRKLSEYTDRWYAFSYTGAYGGSSRFFLDIDFNYGLSEQNPTSASSVDWTLYKLGITFGPAFQRFAIYFNFDYLMIPPGDSDVYPDEYSFTFDLNPKWWFGDHVAMSLDLYYEVGFGEYPFTGFREKYIDLNFGAVLAFTVRF